MYTIKNNVIKETIIKNSRFICLLRKVDSIDEINHYLKEASILYPMATHYPYAYILDNVIKSSDDKEPKKTAGAPILNVLVQNNLNHILAIVVRYYGGIKLGASNLLRAYSNSVIDALDKDNIKELIKGKNITISFDYNLEKQVDFILKDSKILQKEYNDKLIYNIDTTKETIEKLSKYDITIDIIKDTYI